jgi:hypothetical protein
MHIFGFFNCLFIISFVLNYEIIVKKRNTKRLRKSREKRKSGKIWKIEKLRQEKQLKLDSPMSYQ